MKPIVLVGGGGHCRSVIEAAESAGYPIRGILLDVASNVGTTTLGVEVIGTDSMMPTLAPSCVFLIALGGIKNLALRRQLGDMVETAGGTLTTVVASSATVSRHARVGCGVTILHGAHINAEALIGKGAIINTGAIIEHDATIGPWCHISTGAIVNGGAVIGDCTFVGSGAVISQGVKVCPGAIIGAGTVVINDITEPGTYVGVPARKVKP